MPISRRDFLKKLGIGAGAVAVGAKLPVDDLPAAIVSYGDVSEYSLPTPIQPTRASWSADVVYSENALDYPIGIALDEHTIQIGGLYPAEPGDAITQRVIPGEKLQLGDMVVLRKDGKAYRL